MAYDPRSYVTADSIGGLQQAEMQRAQFLEQQALAAQAANERAAASERESARFNQATVRQDSAAADARMRSERDFFTRRGDAMLSREDAQKQIARSDRDALIRRGLDAEAVKAAAQQTVFTNNLNTKQDVRADALVKQKAEDIKQQQQRSFNWYTNLGVSYGTAVDAHASAYKEYQKLVADDQALQAFAIRSGNLLDSKTRRFVRNPAAGRGSDQSAIDPKVNENVLEELNSRADSFTLAIADKARSVDAAYKVVEGIRNTAAGQQLSTKSDHFLDVDGQKFLFVDPNQPRPTPAAPAAPAVPAARNPGAHLQRNRETGELYAITQLPNGQFEFRLATDMEKSLDTRVAPKTGSLPTYTESVAATLLENPGN